MQSDGRCSRMEDGEGVATWGVEEGHMADGPMGEEWLWSLGGGESVVTWEG